MLKMHTTVGSVAPSAIHTSTIRYFTLRFQFEVSVEDAEQQRIKLFIKLIELSIKTLLQLYIKETLMKNKWLGIEGWMKFPTHMLSFSRLLKHRLETYCGGVFERQRHLSSAVLSNFFQSRCNHRQLTIVALKRKWVLGEIEASIVGKVSE